MSILNEIVQSKIQEVAERKSYWPENLLKGINLYQRKTISLAEGVLDPAKTGIIAEFKRKSPSKGIINDQAAIEYVAAGYAESGASGMSVLTDGPYFGGSAEDMVTARKYPVALLRKDFLIDAYQVHEARAFGADAILLIAACLSVQQVADLSGLAAELGMETLLELHDGTELNHVCSSTRLIGVNNRNLNNFEVNLQHSIQLGRALPADKVRIAESGIKDIETIRILKQEGFHGFLIGERFMREPDPAIAFARFAEPLK